MPSEPSSTPAASDPPLVSVIMPVRNEQKAIRRSLGAVLAQDYAEDRMEVLVADGMSEDDTRTIVNEMAARDKRVRLVENPAVIMTSGFNAGLRLARGEVIVMLGGHTEIEPNYLRNCVRHLRQGKADCVGGPIKTVCQTSKAAAIALALSSRFGVGGVAFRLGADKEQYVDTVPWGAYTREIIERVGPLDEELVRDQDDEYNYRLRKLGGRILLAPDVRSSYYSRSSLHAVARQYFQYGYWKVRVMQKNPRQMKPRHFVPPAFVAALLTTFVLIPLSAGGIWLFSIVGGCYLVANLGASLLTVGKNTWRLFPVLPAAFATIHLSWGLGALVGLVRFWNRWGDNRLGDPRIPSESCNRAVVFSDTAEGELG
jgi:cellulose synthase/poly-beta-1,6-N-acetylglucosamine synthase-like glycosyltransferase